jgi:ABC-type dipeptide/oligopeptide/nickel transport system permease subunit
MLQAPMLVLAPAVALAGLVLCFNILGDLLRDRLDPRGGRHNV